MSRLDTGIEKQVERLLDNYSRGLSVEHIRSLLASSGIPTKKDEVVATLNGLRAAGSARVGHDRKWRSTRAESLQSAARESGRKGVQSDGSASYQADETLEALPASVTEAPNSARAEPFPDGQLASNLQLLGKLLPYYQEALRIGDQPPLKALPVEKHGKTFALVRPYGQWWPTGDSSTTLRIARSLLPSDLSQAIAQRQGSKLLLGYPNVAVGPQDADGFSFLRPVALQRCDFRFTDTHLELIPSATPPGLNSEWLRGARYSNWKPEQLKGWLFFEDQKADFRDDDDIQPDEFVTFPRFCDRLSQALGRELRTRLDPDSIDNSITTVPSTGVYNVMTLIADAQGPYTRGAVNEYARLTQLSPQDFAGTAAGALFNAPSEPFPQAPLVHPVPMSETQLAATRSALEGLITSITGPPGAGKSQVITAIMVSAAAAGRNVLFASKNHRALDAVHERLNQVAGEAAILTRANDQNQGSSFTFSDAVQALQTAGGSPAGSRVAQGYEAIEELDRRRWSAIYAWQALQSASDRAARALERIDTLDKRRRRAAAGAGIHVSDEPAVTVRPEPPKHRALGTRILRRIKRAAAELLRQLRRRLGFGAPSAIGSTRLVEDLGSEIEEARDELRKAEAEVTARRADVAKVDDDPVALTEQITDKAKALTPRLAEQLRTLGTEERQKLLTIANEHKLTGRSAQQFPVEAAQIVLRHMPLWAVTTLSASSRIPLAAGLFDYVIFDEASQVDIASALPLLYRAKAAVVVGDPNQLAMINNVPLREERDLLKRFDLLRPGIGQFAQGQVNLFEFARAAHATHRHLLTEHFRCHPEIAGYINDAFYGRQLTALTDTARLKVPPQGKPGLHWTDVKGPVKRRAGRGPGGSAASEAEAKAVVDELKRILQGRFEGTIGIVTFFNYQAELLTRKLNEAFSRDQLDRHNVGVFTTNRFQGDERDVILFSLCLSSDMPSGALSFIRKERRLLNVSVSRARAVCHVFGDKESARNSGIDHIERLVNRAERKSQREEGRYEDRFDSVWERRLYDALAARGLSPIPQYPTGGRFLDLALVDENRTPAKYLDIEVDGVAYHQDFDGKNVASDLWRDHQLRGLGWEIVRLWVYELRDDMEGCVERINAAFQR